MNRKDLARFVIGVGIPLAVAIPVMVWVEPMLNPAFDAIPLWIHLLINGVALLLVIAIVYWAVTGGIPPRYSGHRRGSE